MDNSYIPYQITFQIGKKPSPIPNAGGSLFEGVVGNKECVFRHFSAYDEAVRFCNDLFEVAAMSCIPSTLFLNSTFGSFQATDVCLEVQYKSIWSFFLDQYYSYDTCPPGVVTDTLYQFFGSYYEQIFFGAIRGMLSLLSCGFMVKNFKHSTTVVHSGFDKNHKIIYRPVFLDIARITNDNGVLILQSIKDVRDLMAEVLELSRKSHKELDWHIERGVPESIMNFLNNATDDYIYFMGVHDPEYVLNDPMIWSFEDKVLRSWYYFMFLEDSPFRRELNPYFETFPKDWKRNVRRGSFFDDALTMQVRKNEENRLKVALADKIISQEQLRRREREAQNIEDYEDIVDEYEKELESVQRRRGLVTYKNFYGVRWIVKMKRNGTNHHNQNAVELKIERPLKTLKAIVDMVENEFNFSCSKLFWFFNDVWYEGLVDDWSHLELHPRLQVPHTDIRPLLDCFLFVSVNYTYREANEAAEKLDKAANHYLNGDKLDLGCLSFDRLGLKIFHIH